MNDLKGAVYVSVSGLGRPLKYPNVVAVKRMNRGEEPNKHSKLSSDAPMRGGATSLANVLYIDLPLYINRVQ